MTTLFHLRLDVRKVQDYIFQVPKLKFMLGANSKIGELFSTYLPELMPEAERIFSDSLLTELSDGIANNFKKNIISSSGGHFEALFYSKDAMDHFADSATRLIADELPDLEYAISWREFQDDIKYCIFKGLTSQPCILKRGSKTLIDLPYYQLCQHDGVSVGSQTKDSKVVGDKAVLMFVQADKFYGLKTKDTITQFYISMNIKEWEIADELKELANQGKSLKSNMLAYLKIDGNGTGARFRKEQEPINGMEVLKAFIAIEKFWDNNRNQLLTALRTTLVSEVPANTYRKLPYILLMLGGDDLFIVCVPELALNIATKMATETENATPISVGIAYVKDSYPIALANHLAESCLESAKAGSYSNGDSKPPYIDWHVHFDSVFQDITDIRRTSYLLQYKDNGSDITEVLTKRPYSLADAKALLGKTIGMAKMLDNTEEEAANNKIKSYRSILKNGYRDLEFYRDMILDGESALRDFFGYQKPKDNIRLDAALDSIELMEIYRKKPVKGGR